MVTRQRIVTFGIPALILGALSTVVTAALLHQARQPAPPVDCIYPPKPAEPFVPVTSVPSIVTDAPRNKHHIDVVFAIDTTASMGSLIEGARRTVWGIADNIRKTDPGADLRVGLVAYRDNDPEAEKPEAYLTRPFALTTDLDAVYQELRGYDAAGGWTQPENVAAGLWDALRMAWRPSATKLVFVVGDAEPADRGDVPGHAAIIGEMVKRGIVVNAIQVGSLPATATAFRRMAQLGGGEYTSTAQSGGVQQIATPYDAEIAELEARITRTTVFVGQTAERAAWQGRMAAAEAAPVEAKADRAGYYAKKALASATRDAGRTDRDLVGGSGGMTLDSVAEGDLPEDMRALDRAARQAELSRRAAERTELQARIAELAATRDMFLAAERAKTASEGGFDGRVKAVVEKQMK